MSAGKITRVAARVDEYAVRQLALQHAVTTHGATVDDDQVVKAAEGYLAFLTGGAAISVQADCRINVIGCRLDGELLQTVQRLGTAKAEVDSILVSLRDAGLQVDELEKGNIVVTGNL